MQGQKELRQAKYTVYVWMEQPTSRVAVVAMKSRGSVLL